MMLNGGKHGRERILSRLSVELMTTDHLTPEQKAASEFFPGFWETRGWGFGLSIITRRDDVAGVPGAAGTAAMEHPPIQTQGGPGRDPDDPVSLGFPHPSGCPARFLDLGLPGDR